MAEITGLGNIRSADQTLTDDLTVTDDLAVTGKVTIGETLTVTGALTANGNATIGNATTDTIGFYGVTAVDQPAAASQAIYTLTCLTDVSGDSTTAQQARINQAIDDLAGLSTLLHEIRGQLISVGLIKGSA